MRPSSHTSEVRFRDFKNTAVSLRVSDGIKQVAVPLLDVRVTAFDKVSIAVRSAVSV